MIGSVLVLHLANAAVPATGPFLPPPQSLAELDLDSPTPEHARPVIIPLPFAPLGKHTLVYASTHALVVLVPVLNLPVVDLPPLPLLIFFPCVAVPTAVSAPGAATLTLT